jgi:hypothetical protein
MDEKYLKLMFQVTALEYLVQRLYMFSYAGTNLTPDQIRQSHENMRTMARTQKWPGLDVGHTALASGGIEDAIGDFLNGLESMLGEKGLLPKGS